MKKILYNVYSYLLLALLVTMAVVQSGCKKDQAYSTANPVITGVRNYFASPGDSLLSKTGPGQWVVVRGQNLKGALQIYFDGTKASFNDAWFSDTSAVVLLPSVIAFPSVQSSQLNTIRYVTTHGETTFSFSIVAPAPTISAVSNEAASPGDSVTISGFNFFFIKSIVYAGKTVTGFTGSNDGTTIRMAVPAGVTTGPVTVTTNTGSATTVYTVHDFVTGVACNFDAINTYPWGSGTSNSSTSYPGNTGYYDILGATNLPAGGTDWYNYPHSINLYGVQWVPAANVATGSLDSYAVKFEMSVTSATPWVNGTMYIVANYNFNNMAAYSPWLNSNGTTTAFTTKGWQTVTIPLSSFLISNGSTGTPPASITALLGSSGNNALEFMFMNYGKTNVASFAAAIDNIRVVKIK
jgi:hypothetical protein